MSFRVKVRMKHLKLSGFPALPRVFGPPPEPAAGCSVCGMKFTDVMGRPVAMGYACPNIRCPGKATCISIGGTTYDATKTMLWNGSYAVGGVQ